jgi:hypothetical protein
MLFGPFYIIYAKVLSKSLPDIAGLERFYITPVLLLIIFIPSGILLVGEIIRKLLKRPILRIALTKALLAAFIFIPLSMFITFYRRTDLGNVYIGDNLAKDVLIPLSNNSFLFVDNDEFAFNTLYYQLEYDYKKISRAGRNTGLMNFSVRRKSTLSDVTPTF